MGLRRRPHILQKVSGETGYRAGRPGAGSSEGHWEKRSHFGGADEVLDKPGTVSASEVGSVCGGLKPWISVALFLIREKKLREGSMWRYIFFPSTLILQYIGGFGFSVLDNMEF
ncbi:hypothetical protein RHGRI_034552 [Rhododendron griersonianum]|uniref:Uncharacterized protein n=1 Tax=Rhododendron griersonianum TaxID=479676 RepID=A0AAV6I1J1_9ERIC|nr:hypothetical protein RHGRI_034552 [Rhododendron griersonianum]